MTRIRFQIRRAPSSEWTTKNTVLMAGEIGYETDTRRMKIGDGVTPWPSLVYFSDSPFSHASSHTAGGSDPLSLALSQISVDSTATALDFRSDLRITYGSAAPTGGEDGDIYLQFS